MLPLEGLKAAQLFVLPGQCGLPVLPGQHKLLDDAGTARAAKTPAQQKSRRHHQHQLTPISSIAERRTLDCCLISQHPGKQ